MNDRYHLKKKKKKKKEERERLGLEKEKYKHVIDSHMRPFSHMKDILEVYNHYGMFSVPFYQSHVH